MFIVSVQNVDGTTVLKCRGRLVRGEEKRLLCAAVQLSGNVTVEMSGVEAIDAAGIGLLVSLQAAGVYLTVLNPSRHVRTVLRLTGLDSVVQVCDRNLPDELVPGQAVAAPFPPLAVESVPLAS